MVEIPAGLRYTKSHEWARQEAQDTVVGITAHAQEELRDVVFVELPAVDRKVKQGEAVAVVESVKAAFDIYAPVSGTITRVNEELSGNPGLVNDSCYGRGWMFAIKPDDPGQWKGLMDAQAYEALLAASH
jgi:glycine cleavage system H protein